MKRLISFFFLFIPVLCLSQDSIFNYIMANTAGNSAILVRFEIKGGNTCYGIRIEKSINDSVYQTIHTIYGICGNTTEPVAYQFIDESPVANQTNYYRIVPGLGTPTRAVSVFYVDLNTEGYYLYPNPTENQIKIYFQNNDQTLASLTLLNQQGQMVLSEQTNSDLWMPDLSLLPSGIYFFSIELSERIVFGKFIKK